MIRKMIAIALILCMVPVAVFAAPAERIVSCYYISTATLLALRCGDSLTGIEKKAETRPLYTLCAPEVLSLPAVGSGKELNIEEILLLAPDLVVIPRKLEAEGKRLEEMGIHTLTVHPESEPEFLDMVRMLGEETGTEEQAGRLLSLYEESRRNLEERLAGVETPSVYLAAESGVFITYPEGLYQNDLILRAGGENVAGDVKANAKVTVDPEQLMNWDPEYIIIVSGADYAPEDVLGDPRLAGLRAVKNGRVYAMPDGVESWDYPTPTSILGAWYIASLLHPDRVPAELLGGTAAAFYGDVYGFTPTAEELGITAP